MLSVALAAIALGAVTVAPASAATGNDIIEIRSVARGDCLQPDSAQPHAGPGAGACTGELSQRWEVIPVGEGRQLLRNLASTECLSEKYGSYYCDDEAADMRVELVPDGSGPVRLKIVDEYLTGFTFSDGSRAFWFSGFSAGDEQRWQVRQVGRTTPPADTAGQVVNIRTVDFTYGCLYQTTDNKLMPLQLPCGKTDYQKFQRIELGNGRTALRGLANGKCVAASASQPLEIEVVSDCSPDDVRQQWSIEPTMTGAVRIREASGERLLTPGDGWVFLYPRQNNSWQLWELTAA